MFSTDAFNLFPGLLRKIRIYFIILNFYNLPGAVGFKEGKTFWRNWSLGPEHTETHLHCEAQPWPSLRDGHSLRCSPALGALKRSPGLQREAVCRAPFIDFLIVFLSPGYFLRHLESCFSLLPDLVSELPYKESVVPSAERRALSSSSLPFCFASGT